MKATDGGTKRTRLSRGLLRILFMIAGSIAGLLIAEEIARVAAPYPMSFPWMDQVNGVLAPLPSVHGRHFVPGIYDTTFSFSSQRFRGQEVYTPTPASRVLRIAALGASFTFGSGANDVDAYPFQLQEILQQQATRDGWNQTIEVINAGIAGSVAAEQALWYDNWVRNFHPNVVILDIACSAEHPTGLFQIDNDGKVAPRVAGELQVAGSEGLAVRKMTHRVPGFTFLSEHSELLNLFRLAEGEVLRHKGDAALGADLPVSDSINPANDLLEQELRSESGEVRWLKRRVDESGATLVIVVFPCRENVYSSQSKWAPRIRKEYPLVVNALRELSISEGVPFTELSSVFIEKAKREQPLYYDGKFETHPTPAGYRMIAAALAQFLVEQGVVPRGTSTTGSP